MKRINLSHNPKILEKIQYLLPFFNPTLEEIYLEGCGLKSFKELSQISSPNILKLDLRNNKWKEDVIVVLENVL